MPKKPFKPFWKTCEFVSTVIFFLSEPYIFRLGDTLAVKIMTSVICAYIISRALFKQNRAEIILEGHKTSEFWIYIAWMGILIVAVFKTGLDRQLAYTCAGATQICFVLARGYTKGHSAVKATVVNL